MRRRYGLAIAAVVAVLAVAVVLLLGRVMELEGQLGSPGSEATASAAGTSQSPSTAGPSSSADPSMTSMPTPSPGSDEVGGAVWYPSTTGSGSILIAAADGPDGDRSRADVVVDGAADDEINAALAELAGHGGGQVTLLGGVFELANTVVINGDGLALIGTNVGNGAGYSESALGTMIVPAASFPANGFLVQATAEAYGPLISLIHFDGLDRAQGLLVEGRRPTVTLNAVTQATDAGMRFAGTSTGNRPYDGFVLFNRVFDGAGVGIFHDSRSGDMLIEGNIVFRNDGDGFRCLGASQMYRVNHAYNNGGMGLRIIPGCVRTRLSSNKWEGNATGGVSIEGGSGFTIVGDTFAHNEADQPEAPAHIQVGVSGDTDTTGVMMWGLSFGKGSDSNRHLVHVGSRGNEVHLGPVHSSGGHTDAPYRIDPGGELLFYEAVPELVVE